MVFCKVFTIVWIEDYFITIKAAKLYHSTITESWYLAHITACCPWSDLRGLLPELTVQFHCQFRRVYRDAIFWWGLRCILKCSVSRSELAILKWIALYILIINIDSFQDLISRLLRFTAVYLRVEFFENIHSSFVAIRWVNSWIQWRLFFA